MSEKTVPQSAPRPRNTIDPGASYVALHQALSRLACDLRKPDSLFRKAEESLAEETSEQEKLAALKRDLIPARRALDEAEGAYYWYARAISAAGPPPYAVRAIAEPLDAALKVEQRKVALLNRNVEANQPEFFNAANPPPHMKLRLAAEEALIEAAQKRAAATAHEVCALLEEDEDLYREHPDRIPSVVDEVIAQVAELQTLAMRLNFPRVVEPTFVGIIAESGFKGLIDSRLDLALGRRATAIGSGAVRKAVI